MTNLSALMVRSDISLLLNEIIFKKLPWRILKILPNLDVFFVKAYGAHSELYSTFNWQS